MSSGLIFLMCGSLGFLAIVFSFLAFMRYMSYRETLALAEKGLVKSRVQENGRKNSGALRWGIIITALGLALCIGLYPIGLTGLGISSAYPLGFGPWMLAGLVPTFFGLALILIHVLTGGKQEPEKEDEQIETDDLPDQG